MTAVLAHELMTLGTSTPRLGVDWDRRPSRYLTIDGMPAYQIGYGCGTCGLVLRREPGAPADTISAAQVRDRLNTGLSRLDSEVINAFSAQLPHGDYLVMLLEIQPKLVTPGSADDYFETDGPQGWQTDEHESSIDPTNIPYYRLGHNPAHAHDELFEFTVPMTDPEHVNAATVADYTNTTDGTPTAVAFGLLDVAGPWFCKERHWGLFHFLLDGHHKMAAAAATGLPIRLLSFISTNESLACEDELLRLVAVLQATNTAPQE